MNKDERIEIWGKRLINFLILGSILVNIKSIFADYDVDVEYAVTMAYRLACGEQMFTDMWEPHQTSAFLCALFIKPFLMLFRTTTGLVVYLNFCSFILYSGVVYFFYNTVREKVSGLIGLLMLLFLFTVRVKDVQILEFANMQIMFSVLLFSCLLKYYDNQNKKIWLVLGALSLCAEIVSYPSCIIVFPLVLIMLGLYSRERIKDIVIFSCSCAVTGAVYVGYFLCSIGVVELLEAFGHILVSDNYHKKTIGSLELYFPLFNQSIAWLVKCFVLAIVVSLILWYILKRKEQNKQINKSFLLMCVFCTVLMFSDVYLVIVKRERFTYIISYLLLIAIAFWGWKYCCEEEKRIVNLGFVISIGSFFSTMLLTDLDLLSVIRYLIVAVAVTMIPISKLLDRQRCFHKSVYLRYLLLIMFIAVTVFRRGFMFKGESYNGYNLLDIGGGIASGPEAGIITEYFTAYNKNQSREDWKKYVRPSDSLLIVGNGTVDCINYLYEDVIISNPSTISTPTYTEAILDYWEAYPDRFPTVIAVSCWFGELHMPEESWIMDWIDEKYKPCEITDGMYWRFYRLNE